MKDLEKIRPFALCCPLSPPDDGQSGSEAKTLDKKTVQHNVDDDI
jgi:hypothetical protein